MTTPSGYDMRRAITVAAGLRDRLVHQPVLPSCCLASGRNPGPSGLVEQPCRSASFVTANDSGGRGGWILSWRRSTNRLAGARPKAVAIAGICLALIGSGCGTRLAHGAIVAAGQQIVAGATSGGSQASGPGASKSSNSAGGTAGSDATGTAGSGGSGGSGSAGSTASGAAASGGPTAAKAGAASGSTINLGNVGTYSGLIGAIFSGAQQALQAWAAYTNAHGGLNGHPCASSSRMTEAIRPPIKPRFNRRSPRTTSSPSSGIWYRSPPAPACPICSNRTFRSSGATAPPNGGKARCCFRRPRTSAVRTKSVRAAVAAGYTKMGVSTASRTRPAPSDTTSSSSRGRQGRRGQSGVFGLVQYHPTGFHRAVPRRPASGGTVIYFAGDGDSLVRLARDCRRRAINRCTKPTASA